MSSEREELVAELLERSRVLSTETVMFHAALAAQSGLSAVESKVGDYLDRLGPLTPKELAEYSGLAPASVTALIDRLERRGIVDRLPHPADRRKVLVRINPQLVERGASRWDYIVSATRAAADEYTDEQLETVISFLERAAAITHESAARITRRAGE